jgi:hypothetical protein
MGGAFNIFVIFFPTVSYFTPLASNINKYSSNLDSSLSSLFFYNLVTQKEMDYREWSRMVLPNISWLSVEA